MDKISIIIQIFKIILLANKTSSRKEKFKVIKMKFVCRQVCKVQEKPMFLAPTWLVN